MQKTNEQIALRTASHSIIVNILLSAFKLFAGIFANSAAMIADAIHSITDLVSTVIVIIGVKLAGKKPDEEHQYGHERFECVATLLVAALIFVIGAGIGWTGLQAILARDFDGLTIPGMLALVAAVVSIIVKEGLYWYVRATAKKIDSGALMADAIHSRADGLSSIGSLIGIGGAMLGFPVMDSLAALVICIFILKTAIEITLDAIGKMTDRACDKETSAAMREIILAQENVQGIDRLRTRTFGNKIYVDVDICVQGTITLNEAHTISEVVHDAIEREFPKVKHCMVHVNPAPSAPAPHSKLP